MRRRCRNQCTRRSRRRARRGHSLGHPWIHWIENRQQHRRNRQRRSMIALLSVLAVFSAQIAGGRVCRADHVRTRRSPHGRVTRIVRSSDGILFHRHGYRGERVTRQAGGKCGAGIGGDRQLREQQYADQATGHHPHEAACQRSAPGNASTGICPAQGASARHVKMVAGWAMERRGDAAGWSQGLMVSGLEKWPTEF